MSSREKDRETKYTSIMCAIACVAFFCPHLPLVRGVSAVNAVFVWACFHTAYVVDNTCFGRMRSKNRWTLWQFHAGNFVFHHLPLMASLCDLPDLTLLEVAMAGTVFLAWLVYVTNGSMYPNNVYVPMARKTWNICYLSGCFACLALYSHPAIAQVSGLSLVTYVFE